MHLQYFQSFVDVHLCTAEISSHETGALSTIKRTTSHHFLKAGAQSLMTYLFTIPYLCHHYDNSDP